MINTLRGDAHSRERNNVSGADRARRENVPKAHSFMSGDYERKSEMWYVMQVRTGSEENIKIQCERTVSDNILERCFIPYYEERRHLKGNWTTIRRILFPGYVFLITEYVEELYQQLKCVLGMTKILGSGGEIVPLSVDEVNFLERIGGEEQLVEMSEGVIEGGQVRIYQGPLQGMEGQVKKIDRHKRKAWLEIRMFGRMQLMQVGLEIVEKR